MNDVIIHHCYYNVYALYSGDVVTVECVDKLIRKNNMLCPISGRKLKESDIILVVRVSNVITQYRRINDGYVYRKELLSSTKKLF